MIFVTFAATGEPREWQPAAIHDPEFTLSRGHHVLHHLYQADGLQWQV